MYLPWLTVNHWKDTYKLSAGTIAPAMVSGEQNLSCVVVDSTGRVVTDIMWHLRERREQEKTDREEYAIDPERFMSWIICELVTRWYTSLRLTGGNVRKIEDHIEGLVHISMDKERRKWKAIAMINLLGELSLLGRNGSIYSAFQSLVDHGYLRVNYSDDRFDIRIQSITARHELATNRPDNMTPESFAFWKGIITKWADENAPKAGVRNIFAL